MDITIRKAGLMDEKALRDLARTTILACYTPFLGSGAVEEFLNSGASDLYLQDSLGRATVVVSGRDVIGVGACNRDLIELMMIHPGHQRQGVGSALLGHLEREMAARHEFARVESFEDNSVANAFYAARGWARVRSFTRPGEGMAMVEFNKCLDLPTSRG